MEQPIRMISAFIYFFFLKKKKKYLLRQQWACPIKLDGQAKTFWIPYTNMSNPTHKSIFASPIGIYNASSS